MLALNPMAKRKKDAPSPPGDMPYREGYVGVWLGKDLKAHFKALADKDGRKMGNQIRRLVEEYVQRENGKKSTAR